jgi:protein-disulfide isomerase
VSAAGSSLGSAPPPPIGPGDHVRGPAGAAEAILYLDLACPRCAATWPRIAGLPLRLCVRHFPVASKRPRSPDLHRAAEAAALRSEEAFWSLWDSLLADRAHVDDPHLWERARRLGIDPAEFDRDRRSEPVGERVKRDFRSGIRAGVVSTPAAFAGGRALPGEVDAALVALAR